MFHLQCSCWWKAVFTQNLTIHGLIHSFLHTDQLSWSLCREPVWCSLKASQHSLSSKHDKSSCYKKLILFWFCLTIWHSPSALLGHPNSLSNFRQVWTCFEDLSDIARFQSRAAQWVTDGSLCYFGPSSLQVTRSSRVVLEFVRTVLLIIITPQGEILCGAPDRGTLSVVLYVFHFRRIAPTVAFLAPSFLPVADTVFSLV